MENYKPEKGEGLEHVDDNTQDNYVPTGDAPEGKKGLRTPAKIAIGVGIAIVVTVILALIMG